MFGYGRGAMDGFPMDPELPLDIVPVDTSINAILAALAATAGRSGVHVFQIGSSHCNPLRARSCLAARTQTPPDAHPAAHLMQMAPLMDQALVCLYTVMAEMASSC